MPNGCAFRMEVMTVLEGRPGRGALYMPGIPRDQVVLNTVDEEYAQELVTAWGLVAAAAVTAGWELVVRSKFAGNLARTSCLVSHATGIVHRTMRSITSAGASLTLASAMAITLTSSFSWLDADRHLAYTKGTGAPFPRDGSVPRSSTCTHGAPAAFFTAHRKGSTNGR